jgi:hypothetical protein
METYKKCLRATKGVHHKCQDQSKVYLKCRQDNALMADTPLEEVRQEVGMGEGELPNPFVALP